jgi:hypothetical protein
MSRSMMMQRPPPLRAVGAGEGWGGGDAVAGAAPIPTFPRKQGKESCCGAAKLMVLGHQFESHPVPEASGKQPVLCARRA